VLGSWRSFYFPLSPWGVTAEDEPWLISFFIFIFLFSTCFYALLLQKNAF
jgi:hypothetical protein